MSKRRVSNQYQIYNNQGVIEKNKTKINSNPSTDSPNDTINFKKDLEILIRIFYYNKYLREKDNITFKNLIGEKKCGSEIVYLINNSWMEEYKSFFYYKDLEHHLKNKIKDFSEETINKIINNLPIGYLNKINKKDKIIFDKDKVSKYEINKFNENINYFCNNQIINTKIHDLLKESGYVMTNSLIGLDLYFIGFYKILLYFPNKTDANKYIDEIGAVNEKGVFTPECIIDYANNIISPADLNDFIMI